MLNCIQKHAGGPVALTSLNGDQSSPVKYVTAPSTPSVNRINYPSEPTIPIFNSLLAEEDVSVDLLSFDDEEIHFDNLTGEEAPWVLRTYFLCLLYNISNCKQSTLCDINIQETNSQKPLSLLHFRF